ncbi:TetR/AcrR family transcriptional regulator [Streptomyces prunicolor]|uniref:TetR/AcrR family transcriptional regulator n=1 Tax=Streptomyces prunicolor TaxID=67348 RepID=UPI0003A1C509|nr:TetR family transcriptional regulator [Streptomyces prunicolor]
MPHAANKANAPTKSGRRPRGSLSSEAILEAAFALAEEDNLDALSMPKVASRLGVGVTSLYWYYRSKEELLDAMLVVASGRFLGQLPDYAGLPWDEHCRSYFGEMRRIFHDNPVLCDFLIFRNQLSTVRPRTLFLDRIDREVSILLDAGFAPETAARGYMAMSVYTQGCVQKTRLFERTGEQENRFVWHGSDPIWASQSPEEQRTYPGMEQTQEYWSVSFAADADFESGLEFIIDGLRGRLKQPAKPARKRAAPRKQKTES